NWASTMLDGVLSKVPTRGTDTITIRAATGEPTKLADDVSSASGNLKVTNTKPFNNGDILLITDCVNAAIFQATEVDDSTGVLKRDIGSGANWTLDFG